MTTIVLKLPPALARRLATAADNLGLEHDELVVTALRLFLRSVLPAPARRRPARKDPRDH